MRPKSFSMASLPFHAHSTEWPIWVSIVLTTSMLNSLSSTIRMRPSCRSDGFFVSSERLAAAAVSRLKVATSRSVARPMIMVKKNLVPLP